VATIVLKLFQAVPADVALFGRKDYQQTLVIQRMAQDFDIPMEIQILPTVREADGLAMSSRNAYLSPSERRQALSLWEGLQMARALVTSGTRDARMLQERVIEHLQTAGGAHVDYGALVREGTVEEVTEVIGPTVMLIAARIGNTRLIDNLLLED
jgi:pantoate--beta-alanine ligase